jgi:glycosyltransferase involved in cell wall biosynthesis
MTRILTYMSCHNAAETVARAATSVLQQGGWLLAVDDGSEDNTLQALFNLQVKFPQLLIRANKKQDNWQAALALAVSRVDFVVRFTHVLGIGADDVLLPGCIADMEQHDSDIIWSDYYFTNWRGQAVGVSTSGMVSPVCVTGGGVQEMFADSCNPFQGSWRPSGVACAVERDAWHDMMIEDRAYELGPHSDTIALNLLACQVGATMIPKKLAAFTLRHKDGKKGYSQASNAGGERPAYYAKAVDYIHKHGEGVSREAKDGILRKWFPDLHK